MATHEAYMRAKALEEQWKSEDRDMVNSPPHYTTGKIETWDYIVDVIGEYESISVAHAQVLKYLGSRLWNKENPIQDAEKARWYLDKMIEELETMSAKDVGIVREKLHHYRWLASKLLPSLYGDKQEVIQDTKITIQWQQPEKIAEGQVVEEH